jgi:protocatechuate 3,4-dioxygenase, beta subunit
MQKFLFLFILLISVRGFADDGRFHINKLNHCKLTAAKYNDYEPITFPTSNDLLRADFDKKRIATDHKIIIRGIVLDESCAPVSDAKIYLWQVGTDGKYHYKPLKNRINQNLIKDDSDNSNFIGAGSTITNNQGEFYFITIKPADSFVNLRVNHKDLGTLDARIALAQRSIAKDPIEIRSDFIPIVEEGTFYDFQIVIKGSSIIRY